MNRITDILVYPMRQTFSADIAIQGSCGWFIIQFSHEPDVWTQKKWSIPSSDERCWNNEEAQDAAYESLDVYEIVGYLKDSGGLDKLFELVKTYDTAKEDGTIERDPMFRSNSYYHLY